jgi:hypothetical protein
MKMKHFPFLSCSQTGRNLTGLPPSSHANPLVFNLTITGSYPEIKVTTPGNKFQPPGEKKMKKFFLSVNNKFLLISRRSWFIIDAENRILTH